MTGPLSTAPTATVLINGVALNDGTADPSDDAPMVLTDLRVSWGRHNSVDQPQPSTAVFTLLDPTGKAYPTLLGGGLGAQCDINADAVIYPDPTVSIVADPRWLAVPVGGAISSVRTNATFTAAGPGGYLAPTDPAARMEVLIPPAPFTPGNPAGWDAIPTTRDGQTWRLGADVTIPRWLADVAVATVRPVLFPGPDPSFGAPQRMAQVLPATGPPVAGVVTYLGDYLPPDGYWLGVSVTINPTGPTWEQVPAATIWASLTTPRPSWADLATTLVDRLTVLAPASGANRGVCVFSGRVTDLSATYDEGLSATVVDVTAEDQLSELASRPSGSAPWAASSLGLRFANVVAASGQKIAYTIDPAVTALPMSYRDVDAQPAARLLTELAISADAVLWAATHRVTGPVLTLAAMRSRPPMMKLALGTDGLVHVIINAAAPGAMTVSACNFLLEPTQWAQDSTDVATRVVAIWREQTVVDGAVAPTDRSVTRVDEDLERQFGAHRVGVSTELRTQTSAEALAEALLGRMSTAQSWRVGGLTWDLESDTPVSSADLAQVMTLLDGTTRLGLPILLTDLPEWSPLPPTALDTIALFVEGGTYTNVDGAWTLAVTTSNALAQGDSTLRWQDVPTAYTWALFGPEVSWADLAGVGR